MPPRKRKAKQALAAINEDEPEQGDSQQLWKKDDPAALQNKNGDLLCAALSEADQGPSIVQDCKEQVAIDADNLVKVGRQRASSVRAEGEKTFAKLTKQVRQMSAADFFNLTDEEAASNNFTNILQRLELLQPGGGVNKGTAVNNAAVASLEAVGGAAPVQGAGASSEHHEQPQQHGVGDQGASSSPNETQAAAALMPPPKAARTVLGAANPPARQPMQDEVVYSANGSPIYLAGPSAAVTSVKGTGRNITDETPAVAGPSCANVAPQTLAFTGRTFRRETVARGRTKQPTRAIAVTTEDGKQFTVDDLIGLAGVPEKYREEVRRLMEADVQDLNDLVKTVTAIEETNSVIVPTAAGAAKRSTRRR